MSAGRHCRVQVVTVACLRLGSSFMVVREINMILTRYSKT